jgi:WhiB family redox-sensing transcriptional regulator
MFFIEDDERGATAQAKSRRAKAICAGCPVQAPCLEDALDVEFGIFGGTTARERVALLGRKPGGQRRVA